MALAAFPIEIAWEAVNFTWMYKLAKNIYLVKCTAALLFFWCLGCLLLPLFPLFFGQIRLSLSLHLSLYLSLTCWQYLEVCFCLGSSFSLSKSNCLTKRTGAGLYLETRYEKTKTIIIARQPDVSSFKCLYIPNSKIISFLVQCFFWQRKSAFIPKHNIAKNA